MPRAQHRRSFNSTAGVLLALSLLLSCQPKLDRGGARPGSSLESTDPPTADLVARVKDVSASRLERGLPTVRFEDWVRVNAGPDWNITWGFSQGRKDAALDFPDSVDVRGDTKDGRYFRLSIGTTTTKANQVVLFWLSGAANVQHRWVGLEHLSQLPRLLHHASQSSHTSGPKMKSKNMYRPLYESDPCGESLKASGRLVDERSDSSPDQAGLPKAS